MREELLRGLSQEQIERARRCSDHTELLKLAKAEGVELTDEQLAAIDGGGCMDDEVNCVSNCPNCGTRSEGECFLKQKVGKFASYTCPNCGHHWEEQL